MMESIEKLREFIDDQFVSSGQAYLQGMAIAGSFEREIAEHYQLLPLDADGVPIHVGDRLETFDCPPQDYCQFTAFGFTTTTADGGDWYVIDGYDQQFDVKGVRHVKPRTLEDVLRDVWKEALDYAKSYIWRNPDEVFAERADEIRELMEVGK